MENRPHSGFGIASCVLAALLFLCEASGFGIAGILEVSSHGSASNNPALMGTIGLLILLGIGLGLIGLGMGIAGLFQQDRRRSLAVVGLIVNGVITLGAGALVTVGMIMNHRKG